MTRHLVHQQNDTGKQILIMNFEVTISVSFVVLYPYCTTSIFD
jgi:hypothetical protein